ncbi:hypothetical protein LWI28_026867 [Acer negundo]|uniref:Uncharacterized protein n=1 Tax=Acer negundo TaxID=4023 RepID=A0AAD5IKI8_ACENE|nr:hypothetical protein LWI28_026867 [Acer negundo]
MDIYKELGLNPSRGLANYSDPDTPRSPGCADGRWVGSTFVPSISDSQNIFAETNLTQTQREQSIKRAKKRASFPANGDELSKVMGESLSVLDDENKVLSTVVEESQISAGEVDKDVRFFELDDLNDDVHLNTPIEVDTNLPGISVPSGSNTAVEPAFGDLQTRKSNRIAIPLRHFEIEGKHSWFLHMTVMNRKMQMKLSTHLLRNYG